MDCLLQGRCLDKNIIYQATVENLENNTNETYAGMTATTFKDRLGVHNQSYKNRDLNQTTLSKHVWRLKDMKANYKISYKIVGRGLPYSPKSG